MCLCLYVCLSVCLCVSRANPTRGDFARAPPRAAASHLGSARGCNSQVDGGGGGGGDDDDDEGQAADAQAC